MRHLFVTPQQLSTETITIEGPDAHHLLNVLRVRAGEALILLDNTGAAFHATITEAGKRALSFRRGKPAEMPEEPLLHITVAQALGKGDKFEQVIQHGTEVGASAFIPVMTERTVIKLDANTKDDKRGRWSLIAKGAAEQSGRARIPAVAPATELMKLADQFGEYKEVMVLHPGGERLEDVIPSAVLEMSPCLVIVGPEGGFSDREIECAKRAGARIVSLGGHILRTETAALVAVSQLLFAAQYLSGNRT
jgi:16S rRNA (uracil1498-N3)-methyltransferase